MSGDEFDVEVARLIDDKVCVHCDQPVTRNDAGELVDEIGIGCTARGPIGAVVPHEL